ncbi:PEP-CTERM sorting domain-containing protein [Cyanobacterium sp. IPPAS B-1200]|uniref:PEP-CTERM sorting domain-containing protein n=1 Tax=Cyanobacterium sp. IPPAS B-1200 TaxID=1562720 RepID=UPI00085284B0|nr:PEP-CTERM sorting domain-containing protein [Cyanobacterium sp. IPPAS B-1200]OEJ77858.1 hypothetical protein A5482_14905 [Cyanobacterium sp. IPPAS B-1200]
MKKSTLSTLLVGGLIAPATMIGLTARGADAAAFFVIDDFSRAGNGEDLCGLFSLSQCTYSNNFPGNPAKLSNTQSFPDDPNETNVFGGSRTLNLVPVSGSGSQFGVNDSGQLAFSNATGSSADATISYNGTATDFSEFGFFALNIDSVDLNNVTAILRLSSDGSTFESVSNSINNTGIFSLDLSSFSSSILSSVTNIELTFDAGNDADITLSSIGFQAVPEPSTVGGLLVLGLLGVAGAKKRSHKAEQN